MGMFYFHIRDDLGVLEDADGIELPDMAALMREVVKIANELAEEITSHYGMRFEIADASGQTVLVTSVEASVETWSLMAQLKAAPMH